LGPIRHSCSTDHGGGTALTWSDDFETSQAKLIDRFGARGGFIIGIDRDLCREVAEADVPAMQVFEGGGTQNKKRVRTETRSHQPGLLRTRFDLRDLGGGRAPLPKSQPSNPENLVAFHFGPEITKFHSFSASRVIAGSELFSNVSLFGKVH
jgi:hypothetical protein